MKKVLVSLGFVAALLWGCAMFHSWKAIPPPGGCDKCHTVPISSDWQLAYRPATIHNETGKNAWQSPQSVLPPETSPLEKKKVTEERCFRCHKSPDQAHIEYKGWYHH
jgi:hypothetical protein